MPYSFCIINLNLDLRKQFNVLLGVIMEIVHQITAVGKFTVLFDLSISVYFACEYILNLLMSKIHHVRTEF